MLLGDDMLSLARIWLHRERIEREAARQFTQLAGDLRAAGAPERLAAMAEAAAADEAEHAILCRRVVDHLAPGLAALPPGRVARLGPLDLPVARRALYASVALSCVTETLSAALLGEMRRVAAEPLVRDTVHRILRDEIDHSRLGWAHLAWAAGREDVSWLGPHIPAMMREALGGELPADLAPPPGATGPRHGVLSLARVRDIAARTLDQIVAPGLARHGVLPAG